MSYKEIADAIRKELCVCCDVYERTENLRQELRTNKSGYAFGSIMEDMDFEMAGHENC